MATSSSPSLTSMLKLGSNFSGPLKTLGIVDIAGNLVSSIAAGNPIGSFSSIGQGVGTTIATQAIGSALGKVGGLLAGGAIGLGIGAAISLGLGAIKGKGHHKFMVPGLTTKHSNSNVVKNFFIDMPELRVPSFRSTPRLLKERREIIDFGLNQTIERLKKSGLNDIADVVMEIVEGYDNDVQAGLLGPVGNFGGQQLIVDAIVGAEEILDQTFASAGIPVEIKQEFDRQSIETSFNHVKKDFVGVVRDQLRNEKAFLEAGGGVEEDGSLAVGHSVLDPKSTMLERGTITASRLPGFVDTYYPTLFKEFDEVSTPDDLIPFTRDITQAAGTDDVVGFVDQENTKVTKDFITSAVGFPRFNDALTTPIVNIDKALTGKNPFNLDKALTGKNPFNLDIKLNAAGEFVDVSDQPSFPSHLPSDVSSIKLVGEGEGLTGAAVLGLPPQPQISETPVLGTPPVSPGEAALEREAPPIRTERPRLSDPFTIGREIFFGETDFTLPGREVAEDVTSIDVDELGLPDTSAIQDIEVPTVDLSTATQAIENLPEVPTFDFTFPEINLASLVPTPQPVHFSSFSQVSPNLLGSSGRTFLTQSRSLI